MQYKIGDEIEIIDMYMMHSYTGKLHSFCNDPSDAIITYVGDDGINRYGICQVYPVIKGKYSRRSYNSYEIQPKDQELKLEFRCVRSNTSLNVMIEEYNEYLKSKTKTINIRN